MTKITITMPASILQNYPAAARQMVWQPGYSQITGGRRFCFLQLGWSGGKWAKFHKSVQKDATDGGSRLFVVR